MAQKYNSISKKALGIFFFSHALTSLPNVIIHKYLWKDAGRREQEISESLYILQVNNLLVLFK